MPNASIRDRTTRRRFLVQSSVASAGILLPRPVWALPAGTRQPAPDAPPPEASRAQQAVSASHVPGDEVVARTAVEAAVAAGAMYADARLVLYREEFVEIRDDHIASVRQSERYGLGVRVIADGGWGFAASPHVEKDAAATLAKRAVDIAKRNGALLRSLGQKTVEWVEAPVAQGHWIAPHEIDPFAVSVQEKADLLLSATREALAVPGVRYAMAGVHSVLEDKLFISSEGARVHQIVPRIEPYLTATAIDAQRGRFAERQHDSAPMQAGWEYVTGLDLRAAAQVVASEALQKLYAADVEPGVRHLVLAPSNLWLTIHESIGHATELDRVMGFESNFAGSSYIKPTDVGSLRIGNERVNFMADRTQPGGLATVGWDDDGVRCGRWPLVRDGIFVGWQTTRDQAGWVNEATSRGCGYGQGYEGVAFQRMPNVSLQPGPENHTTEDLINATEDGVLVTGRGSWSIDQQRYNFQFSGQMFWEIKRGRLTRPLRNVAYQSNTLEFWQSCDMLGGEGTYRLGGSFNDGKGEPHQSNAVSHGCPPARFKANIVNTGDER